MNKGCTSSITLRKWEPKGLLVTAPRKPEGTGGVQSPCEGQEGPRVARSGLGFQAESWPRCHTGAALGFPQGLRPGLPGEGPRVCVLNSFRNKRRAKQPVHMYVGRV